MNKFINLFLILVSSSMFFSCAKTDDQITEAAISEARYHLTSMDCSEALEVLNDAGQDKDNPDYVSVYAAAIACQAGYSDIDVAIPNFTSISTTPAGVGLLNSFAAFASSNETTADASTYSKIKEAIDYLLEADGGTQPSTSNRIAKYGANAGNDLSMQALFMVTVALGKYFAYYGNASAAGLKGAGTVTGGNDCLGRYTFDANLNTFLAAEAITNGCDSATSNHDQLSDVTYPNDYKRRMCEGIVLYNNMLDILGGIDLSSNSSLGNLSDVETALTTLYNAAALFEAGLGAYNGGYTWGGTAINTLRNVTSQSVCETQSDADLQRFFVIMFEINFSDT